MLANYTITKGYWKKISAAGELGSAWLIDAKSGVAPTILIAHTDTVQTPSDDILLASALDLDIDSAIVLPKDFTLSDLLQGDNTGDIFYATLVGKLTTTDISVDFATI